MKNLLLLMLTTVSLIVIATGFDTPAPKDKIELGKLLFFDPILSRDRTISCASCHRPEYAFADTSAVSAGVKDRKGDRNTPTAMNLALDEIFFWDGRAKSLEEQALAPIENPKEMDLPVESAIARLNKHKHYSVWFKTIFNEAPNRTNLARAIAEYERTLETSETPFDEWKFGDEAAVDSAVKRGFDIFSKKGRCTECHFGSDFTTNTFRNIGLFDGKQLNDSGRLVISKDRNDLGKFKTPGLRNIALTAPYMHNGIFKTLKEVIEFYDNPAAKIPGAINRDSILNKPLGLNANEKADLEAFLLALTDKRFQKNTSRNKP